MSGCRDKDNTHILVHFLLAPFFQMLSAQLLVEDAVSVNVTISSLLLDILQTSNNKFSHQIGFSLEMSECLSQFKIVIDGLTDTISFNITSSDRERGTVTYTLSNVSTNDVCSVRGSVYGSNDIGDSEPVQFQLPGEG